MLLLRSLATVLLLCVTSCAARAQSADSTSGDGRYRFRLNEDNSGALYAVERSTERKLWTNPLNPFHPSKHSDVPQDCLVDDQGNVAVFYDGFFGTAWLDIILLGRDGRLVRRLPLKSLLSREQRGPAWTVNDAPTIRRRSWVDSTHGLLFLELGDYFAASGVHARGTRTVDGLMAVRLATGLVHPVTDFDLAQALRDDAVQTDTLLWIARRRIPVDRNALVEIYEHGRPELKVPAALALAALGDRRGAQVVLADPAIRHLAEFLPDVLGDEAQTVLDDLKLPDWQREKAEARFTSTHVERLMASDNYRALADLVDRRALPALLSRAPIDPEALDMALRLDAPAVLLPLQNEIVSGDPVRSQHSDFLEALSNYPCDELAAQLIQGLAKSPDDDKRSYARALRFQLGADFGWDAAAWQRLADAHPPDPEAKGRLLLGLGEQSGWLSLREAFGGDRRPRDLPELSGPRLVQVFSASAMSLAVGATAVTVSDGWGTGYSYDLRTGRPNAVCPGSGRFFFAFSSHRLIRSDESGTTLWNTETSLPIARFKDEDARGMNTAGTAFVTWERGPDHSDGTAKLRDVTTGALRFKWAGSFPSWSDNGHVDYMRGSDERRLAVSDFSDRSIQSPPAALFVSWPYQTVHLSGWTARVGPDVELRRDDGTSVLRLRSYDETTFSRVTLSPDGRYLAAQLSKGGETEVWDLTPPAPPSGLSDEAFWLMTSLWTGLKKDEIGPRRMTADEYHAELSRWDELVGSWLDLSTCSRERAIPAR